MDRRLVTARNNAIEVYAPILRDGAERRVNGMALCIVGFSSIA
jgi:hypothetical protein